jgi:integrase
MKNDLSPTTRPYIENNGLQEQGGALSRLETIRDNYTQHFRHFAAFARETGGGVDLETVRQFYLWLNSTGYSASTIRVRRQAVKKRIRQLFSEASEEERAKLEIELAKLDKGESTKAPGQQQQGVNDYNTVSPKEYEKLLTEARSGRQKRFIEFLYTTGARCGEMCKIRLSDCKVEGNVVTISLRGKGTRQMKEKRRAVYITRAMYDRIRQVFGDGEYLFHTKSGKPYTVPYVSNQIRKITKHVLGRALSAHKLRHSFASRKIQETGRVKAVSEYLGHSDVQITLRIYTHDTFSPADVLGPEAVA